MGGRAPVTGAQETIPRGFLSFALPAGLFLPFLSGFRQADPLVGPAIVTFLFLRGLRYPDREACGCDGTCGRLPVTASPVLTGAGPGHPNRVRVYTWCPGKRLS